MNYFAVSMNDILFLDEMQIFRRTTLFLLLDLQNPQSLCGKKLVKVSTLMYIPGQKDFRV